MNKSNQKQQFKKYAIYAIMALIFGIVIWLIYAPSQSDKEKVKQGIGFNLDIPKPKNDAIVDDKQSAYEQEQLREKRKEKMKSLQEYGFMLGDDNSAENELTVENDDQQSSTSKTVGSPRSKSAKSKNTFEASASAYKDMNKTLDTFYETPKEDTEKKAMAEKIEQLEAKIHEKENEPALDDQLQLMEKSYEMAAKYAQNNQAVPQVKTDDEGQTDEKDGKPSDKGKTKTAPVSQVSNQVVSALHQPLSDAEFIRQMNTPRNFGFISVDDGADQVDRNTISASVHDDQTVADGQSVRLRLRESMKVEGMVIPVNTIVTGIVRIMGERLEIEVTSIENEGKIIPVAIVAYDTDGQRGICIPNNKDVSALKDIAANMSSNMGSSINITQTSAGDQLLTDLGRGAIQGTSQMIVRKIKEIKVTLKSGYKIFLLPNNS